MRKLCWLLIIMLLVIPFIACNTAQDKTDAEAVMMEYFETIKAGDFLAALDYYSPEFYEEEISKAEMLQILEGVNEKLGDLEAYVFKNYQISYMNSVAGEKAGITTVRCQITYEITYSIHTATEMYLLVKEDDAEFAIRGFNINSVGLLK